jgi:cell wall-associated NlpC family hydrolase
MRSQDADLRRAETARVALAQTEELANQEVAKLKDLEAKAAKEKATADAKLTEAEDLLSRLKKKERERLAAAEAERQAAAQAASRDALRSTPSPQPSYGNGGSGRAAVAVSYARAQVGKPYVFGGSGPSVFDCSGLTSAAWAQAGVYLPHASSAQYSSTSRVSALQPGDLVFFYSDLHHVGIYVGGGTFVHAANPGDGVVAESLYSSYWQSVYMGAGRV